MHIQIFLVIAKDLRIKGLCENKTNSIDQTNIDNVDKRKLDDIKENYEEQSVGAIDDFIIVMENEELLNDTLKNQPDIENSYEDTTSPSEIRSQESTKIITFSEITDVLKDIHEQENVDETIIPLLMIYQMKTF